MLAAEIYLGLLERNFSITLRGEGLSISPASRLTSDDKVLVQANHDELLTLARGACPGRCLGPCGACNGGPHPEVELLWPSGCVAPQWCKERPDAGAGWSRRRGEETWHALPGRHLDRPTDNLALLAPLLFAADEADELLEDRN